MPDFVDLAIKFLKESIRWYRKKIDELEDRKRELRKRKAKAAGPTEKKYIDEAIESADELIGGYKKMIEKAEKDIQRLRKGNVQP